MNQAWEVITSAQFTQSMYWLGISSFMLAVGAIVCAAAFYGRARDVVLADQRTARWTLLMGTWRDSLIITLLFVADALFFRFSELIGLSQIMSTSTSVAAPMVPALAGLIVMVLIFVVAVLRIILITRWLAAAQSAPHRAES